MHRKQFIDPICHPIDDPAGGIFAALLAKNNSIEAYSTTLGTTGMRAVSRMTRIAGMIAPSQDTLASSSSTGDRYGQTG